MRSTLTAVTEDTPETAGIPILELGVSSDRITQQLQRYRRLVITDNDRPVAVMLKVDDSTLDDTMLDLSRMQALRALKEVQANAVRSGLSNMTLDEINAEIEAARAEKKSGANSR